MTEDVDFDAGKVLCREGQTGQEFFVIMDGEVEVTRWGNKLATGGSGEFFGAIDGRTANTAPAVELAVAVRVGTLNRAVPRDGRLQRLRRTPPFSRHDDRIGNQLVRRPLPAAAARGRGTGAGTSVTPWRTQDPPARRWAAMGLEPERSQALPSRVFDLGCSNMRRPGSTSPSKRGRRDLIERALTPRRDRPARRAPVDVAAHRPQGQRRDERRLVLGERSGGTRRPI